jgi:hypothetical protein
MATPIFRWSGEYFGFIKDGFLFDANGTYVAWAEADGSVWRTDGTYLGDIVEQNYILRNPTRSTAGNREPRPPPLRPGPMPTQVRRAPKVLRKGWIDSL